MNTIWSSKGEKIHTRRIDVATYEYDGQRIIIEGILRDERFHESYSVTGEAMPNGVIHHLVIRLLVHCADLLIEDIDVELIAVRMDECREIIDCLAPVKGMTLTRGFSSKVKELAGGRKGCTHLVELLRAMTPAAFQGFAAHQSREPSNFDADQARMMLNILTDTCHGLREDGAFMVKIKEALELQ